MDALLRDLRLRPPAPRQLHLRLVELVIAKFCQTLLKTNTLEVGGCGGGGGVAGAEAEFSSAKTREWTSSFAVMVSRFTDIRQLVITRFVLVSKGVCTWSGQVSLNN